MTVRPEGEGRLEEGMREVLACVLGRIDDCLPISLRRAHTHTISQKTKTSYFTEITVNDVMCNDHANIIMIV